MVENLSNRLGTNRNPPFRKEIRFPSLGENSDEGVFIFRDF